MSRTETYSVSTDFTNGLSITKLSNEIVNNVNITTTLRKIIVSGDDVNIQFRQAIETSEKTALDTIVAIHQVLPEETGIGLNGNGVLYTKPNDASVYWKVDGGNEINLTVPNMGTTSAASSDTVTSSSSYFYHVDGMTVSAPTDAKYEIRFTSSIETTSNSTVVEIVFYKNGSEISGPILYCGDRSAIYPASLSSVQILSSGDVIKVYARISDGKGNYKIYYRQLILLQLA